MTLPDECAPHSAYQFTDSSVTRPLLTRLWFTRLFPFVPRWLAANLVSLLACGSLLAVLVLSLAPSGLSETATALVFFAALQIYVAGDHLDGMQAVASGTASPLGDFVDHYCDLWAGCILVFGFWSLLGSAPRVALYAMTLVLIVAFATTYAEREADGRLHFTAWGALEANLILALFLLSWAVPPVRTWWRSASPAGVPWYAFAAGVVVAMALGAVVVVARRMRRLPAPLVVAVAGLVALAVLVTRRVELRPVEGWLLLAAFGGRYVARVMHGYLVPARRSWPDPVATVAVIALAIWDLVAGLPSATIRPGAAILGAYLALTLAITTVRIFSSQRRYWVWTNRPVAADRAAASAGGDAEKESATRNTPPHPSRLTPAGEADPSAGP
jgi:phosphatidylglycerophosphate synthase